MECQCAGCYPEREARRKWREGIAKIDAVEDLLRAEKLKPRTEESDTQIAAYEKQLRKLRKELLR